MAQYDVMSLDEQTDALVASANNLLPDKTWSRNSDNWKRLRVTAGATTDIHAHLKSVARDASPLTAEEGALDDWGRVVGVARKGATGASGASAGLIKGTDGSSWDTDDVLVHKSGLRFRAATSGTLDSSGQLLAGIIAIDTGPATRLEAGEILSWASAPAGLEDEVELEAALDTGGIDAEKDGPYRVRVLERWAEPVRGGTASDYRFWAVGSAAFIATAYVYPHRNGLGSVDVAALRSGRGDTRLLDLSERNALAAALAALRPVTATTRVLEVTTEEAAVGIALVNESGVQWAKDWDDSTPPEVLTWNAGTRLLTFADDRPASLAAGHRIVVDGTSGVELVVESLSSTDAVVLVDAKGEAPAAADIVYSGGPLVTPVRDAVLALFDQLGPRVGDFGQGDWDDAIRLSRLFETAQTSDGVLDSEIEAPVATVTPTAETYADDPTVSLLVPGAVVVRYA